MSALEIAVAKLKTVSAVTAITTATRIYAIAAPQVAAAPYVVVNLVDEPDEQMLSGPGGYFDARISVECVGQTGAEANALGEATKGMQVVKGTVGAFSGIDIMKEGSDFSDASDDRSRFRRAIDYRIRWR